MVQFLKHKLLGIPLLVWGLQLIYVAVMLGILVALVLTTKLNERPMRTKLVVVIPYIIIMIAVDIAWRVAIKKRLAGWF